MVRPGVTTRNPRVNRRLPGRRTALTVCHAMSMAMTVVLPAPVASLSASRARPGFACALAAARWSRKRRPSLPRPGATSVSQIAVSAASTWQKKGRMSPKRWLRQCFRRRTVSGVTRHRPGSGIDRHASTRRRSSLMTPISSYCWPSASSAWAAASKTIARWPRFFGLGIGVMNDTRRRRSRMRLVGWPPSSSSQCRDGYS